MGHAKYTIIFAAAALGFFGGMLLFMELGRRLGIRQLARRGAVARHGIGVIDGVVFAVLSLLMGFAFNGAASRFDHRRELVIKEAGMIRTAWQRTELLSDHQQHAVRAPFRSYVDALLAAYAVPPGTEEELRERANEDAARDRLWARTVAMSIDPDGEKARVLLIPSVSLMFEAVHEERLAQRLHPPALIWVMLGVAAFAACLFAGYNLASEPQRNWLYTIGAAATLSVTAYVILELESPRLGLVRVDGFDSAIAEVRAEMEGPVAELPAEIDGPVAEAPAGMD
jgi:hypothetical protein